MLCLLLCGCAFRTYPDSQRSIAGRECNSPLARPCEELSYGTWSWGGRRYELLRLCSGSESVYATWTDYLPESVACTPVRWSREDSVVTIVPKVPTSWEQMETRLPEPSLSPSTLRVRVFSDGMVQTQDFTRADIMVSMPASVSAFSSRTLEFWRAGGDYQVPPGFTGSIEDYYPDGTTNTIRHYIDGRLQRSVRVDAKPKPPQEPPTGGIGVEPQAKP